MPDKVGSDNHKPTSLQAISIKAGYSRKHRFQDLYRCLDESFLQESFYRMNRKAAPGVDQQTWRDYKADLDGNIRNLVERLKAGQYRARLIRRHYIPKATGGRRPLGIPVIEDKLLQTAVSRLLQAIWEPAFLPCSFGYRPKVGARDAVKMLKVNLQFGKYGYVVEADIKGFFDTINHSWLLKMLSLRIDDRRLLHLVGKWLKAGVLEEAGQVVHPATGTPQGGVISPVLANIYLHYVLDVWFEKAVKASAAGKALLCRYADDFVCAFQYRKEAEAFYQALPERLGKFSLAVSPAKTDMIRFSRFHPSHQRSFKFLGFAFYWSEDRQGEARVRTVTARDRLQGSLREFSVWIKAKRHLPKGLFFAALSAKLRGYNNYFGIRGNSHALTRFYWLAMRVLFKWLNRRSQRISMNWEKFKRLLERLKIPKAQVKKQPFTKRSVFA